LVADLRAPTPSAAAAAVVPDGRALRAQLVAAERRLAALAQGRLTRLGEQLAVQERLLKQYGPQGRLTEQRQRVDDLVARGTAALRHRLALAQAQLAGARAGLQALNPRRVLERGYAVVQDARSGAVIASIIQVAVNQDVAIHLKDGSPGAVITTVPPVDRPRG